MQSVRQSILNRPVRSVPSRCGEESADSAFAREEARIAARRERLAQYDHTFRVSHNREAAPEDRTAMAEGLRAAQRVQLESKREHTARDRWQDVQSMRDFTALERERMSVDAQRATQRREEARAIMEYNRRVAEAKGATAPFVRPSSAAVGGRRPAARVDGGYEDPGTSRRRSYLF